MIAHLSLTERWKELVLSEWFSQLEFTSSKYHQTGRNRYEGSQSLIIKGCVRVREAIPLDWISDLNTPSQCSDTE